MPPPLVHFEGLRWPRQPRTPQRFLTTISSWKAGDEFLAGIDLQKFRVLDENTDDVPDEMHGIFTGRGGPGLRR